MTSETSRPVCVYAMAGLKRNSTKLLITMCIGIALALYGCYVQARSQSNPTYMPSISMATRWLYTSLGNTLAHPTHMMKGCNHKATKQTVPHFLMRHLVKPIVQYSGLINGMINLTQIILLKVYCRSVKATNVMIAMSAVGFIISMICMGGAYATCRLMCISCLGIHHLVIIYYANCRRRIIQNILCPPNNTNEGACTYGSQGGGGGSTQGKIFGNTSAQNKSGSDIRRRSGR